ncbi:hypothetical protein GCM10009595_12970 [Falsarthrobacter nasiphocae]
MFVSLLLPPIAALVSAPLLARALGQTGRGEVAAANAPILFTTAVLTFGLGDAATYFIARNKHRSTSLTFRVLAGFTALGALSAVFTWAAAPVLSRGNAQLAELLVLTAAATVPTFVTFGIRAIASGIQAFDLLAREAMITSSIRLAATIALFISGHLSVLSATLVFLLSPVVGAIALLPVFRRIPVNSDLPTARYTELFGYGHRIWLGALSGVVLSRIDQLLMVPLSSEAELGIYVVAVAIGELPSVVAAGVRAITFSADSAEAEGAAASTALRLQMMARMTATASFIAAGAGIALTPWAIPVFFGEEFRPAILPAIVLLIATAAGSAGSVGGAGLSARGRPGLRSLSMLFGALANLLVFFLLVPHTGALGAALATLAGSWVAGTANLIALSRVFGMPVSSFYGIRRSDLHVIISTISRRKGNHAA